MSTAALFLTSAALHLAMFPAFAYSQCVVFDKPEERFARADVVFIGTVLATEPTGAQGAHAIVDVATFRVQQSWKGRLGREVRVGADRPFETGKKYVVFAGGEPLSTSILCRWATPVEDASASLEWLAQRGPQQELADARRKWASREIGEYEYTFQSRCFCDPEFTRPVSFRVSQDGSALLTQVHERVRKSLDRYDTVDELFDFVQSAIDKRAFKLTVTYDEEFGYPRSVRVDYREMTIDEEMAFTVTNFKVLEKSSDLAGGPAKCALHLAGTLH